MSSMAALRPDASFLSQCTGSQCVVSDEQLGSGHWPFLSLNAISHVEIQLNQQLNQTRSQVDRAAMYNIEFPIPYLNPTLPIVSQQFAEPSQMLKHAVVNLINYQDDADLTTRTIPELVKLLNDDDQVVVSQAAMMVHHLSKTKAALHAIMDSPQMVEALVHTMTSSNDLETTECAVGVLRDLSHHRQGLLVLFKFDGVAVVEHCLKDDPDLATRTIPELVELVNDKNQVVVRQAAKMVYHLSKTEVSLGTITRSPQMVPALLRAMTSSEDLETTECAVRVLHNLSHCSEGRRVIFEFDGIPALVDLLSSPVESVLFYAITALHNLLLYQDGSRKAVHLADGLCKLTTLSKRDDLKCLPTVIHCLLILVKGNRKRISPTFFCVLALCWLSMMVVAFVVGRVSTIHLLSSNTTVSAIHQLSSNTTVSTSYPLPNAKNLCS